MSLEDVNRGVRTYAAATSSIIHPRNDKLGRRIIAGNADTAFCVDSKLEKIRGNGKCSPGSAPIWGEYIARSDDASEARLRGAGVRNLTTHPNCGMAKVGAEKALGHPVSQSDADERAHQKTKKFARDRGFGYTRLTKSDMCDECDADHSTITIVRPGVNNAPTRGFRINSITQNPVEADKIARQVAASRGVKDVRTDIMTTSQRDADNMKRRLAHTTNVRAIVVPRRA